MRRLKFNWKYALLIVGVLVLALLVIDFNSRMADMRNPQPITRYSPDHLRYDKISVLFFGGIGQDRIRVKVTALLVFPEGVGP